MREKWGMIEEALRQVLIVKMSFLVAEYSSFRGQGGFVSVFQVGASLPDGPWAVKVVTLGHISGCAALAKEFTCMVWMEKVCPAGTSIPHCAGEHLCQSSTSTYVESILPEEATVVYDKGRRVRDDDPLQILLGHAPFIAHDVPVPTVCGLSCGTGQTLNLLDGCTARELGSSGLQHRLVDMRTHHKQGPER